MNPHPQDSAEAARLEKLRDQLSTDMEAMQQKEASLREYEQRLRLLVEHAQGAGKEPRAVAATKHYRFTNSPIPGQAEIDAAWEKYHRAHALLEAARRSLTDDRLALKEREERLAVREQEVSRREAWVKVREQELTVKHAPPPKSKSRPPVAASPFAAAKRLLSRGKRS